VESYYYTTLTFSVQSAGTDDDLKSELIGAGAAVGLDVAKIEVTSSPDDGRKVRLSTQLGEEEALYAVQRLYARVDDLIDAEQARMVTTRHFEAFNDAEIWPADHIIELMDSRGIKLLSSTFNVAPWFPAGLVQSLVVDAAHVLLQVGGFSPMDDVEGVSTDNTVPGAPTFALWLREDAYHWLADGSLTEMVESWIDEISEMPHLRSWFKSVLGED
jgi:hypothetical protein